jgi:hypothetical protein
MNPIRSQTFRDMAQLSGKDLQVYNGFILRNQEAAFNLACFLLDNENLAAGLVESIFRTGFPDFRRSSEDYYLRLISLIVERCMMHLKDIQGPAEIRSILQTLSVEQKIVVILIDCFDMDYQSVALIIRKPVIGVRKILAGARFNLNRAINDLV